MAKGRCHPRASSAKTRGFHTQLDEGPETHLSIYKMGTRDDNEDYMGQRLPRWSSG